MRLMKSVVPISQRAKFKVRDSARWDIQVGRCARSLLLLEPRSLGLSNNESLMLWKLIVFGEKMDLS